MFDFLKKGGGIPDIGKEDDYRDSKYLKKGKKNKKIFNILILIFSIIKQKKY